MPIQCRQLDFSLYTHTRYRPYAIYLGRQPDTTRVVENKGIQFRPNAGKMWNGMVQGHFVLLAPVSLSTILRLNVR
ncbi:uncharacterized protein BT62DRAFT_933053 [Guyanagaster necrorhizus]|uniref:Uncharacterized protein n=1 Tax=Guyanagaster necrorhizus TaxID=856835 RepID=A0A9P7VRF8_9AGAR|nr:uncharacterized protein BT62DRAFT_933053 [Guyanagaster necrorhizus MCA 3950]KAG7445242.1 hypothetical protein BT62DRAFT_933053 [Guyanagaster necrorhizus MCA 3950]